MQSFANADVSADLARVACPTLVVAGRHDLLLPPEQAMAVHNGIAGSRLEIIEEGAHFLPYQCPEMFAALVLEFLRPLGV